MMNQYSIIVLLLLMLLCSSCIDEITLDIDSDKQFVIVDGIVADDPGEYRVNLNFSPKIGVGNDNILEPIAGARVKLLGGSSQSYSFQEDVDQSGSYIFTSDGLDAQGEYHLEVELPNGDLIKSKVQKFPEEAVELDTLTWNIVEEEFINETGNVARKDIVEMYASTQPNSEAFLRWRVTGEFEIVEKYFGILNPRHCYVKENVDFNNVLIADTIDFSGGKIVDEPIINTPLDSRFNILYMFDLAQYTISEEEYDYWVRIESLINVEGTLFDPPPGILIGNLYNDTNQDENVQGYFSLARLSNGRRFVDVTKLGYFADTDCQSRPNATNPEKCVDCTTLNRSTLEKPSYWLF